MGGLGSGRKRRSTGVKATVHEFPDLNISQLNKSGLLQSDRVFTIQFLLSGRQLGRVEIISQVDKLLLKSFFDQTDRIQTVRVSKMPCNFGGERFWLICPMCGTKRANLYYIHEKWQCRICQNLGYQTQKLSPHRRSDYMLEKIRKTKLRIDPGSGVPATRRPDGMHHKTHAKILNQLLGHQQASSKYLKYLRANVISRINEVKDI